MNEYKVEKIPIIAWYTCNFISKLLQGDKNMVVFWKTIQRHPLIVCVESLSLVGKFQNKISNVSVTTAG